MAIGLFLAWLGQQAATKRFVPVTITVAQDVPVRRHSESGARGVRGVLYYSAPARGKDFVIKKRETFQMVTPDLGEGACRIRFQRNEYELPSCPWLEGFTDHQADIFRVAKK